MEASELQFEENIDLDANMVLAGMRGGWDAICHMAIMTRGFKGPDDVLARCNWFKQSPKRYKDQVIARVVELEKK